MYHYYFNLKQQKINEKNQIRTQRHVHSIIIDCANCCSVAGLIS